MPEQTFKMQGICRAIRCSVYGGKGFSAHQRNKAPGTTASCSMVKEMAPMRSAGYTDPGWQHGVAQDEKKKKVKCNYCEKIVSGGIFRLKQHLARVSGEVTHCEIVPDEVSISMRKNLTGSRSGQKRRQSNDDPDEATRLFKGKKAINDHNLDIRFAPLRSLGYVDPGWEHCVAQDEKKKKVKCNYCEKLISGGINRFKQHLARIPGEVAFCEKAPEDVYLSFKENMKWHRSGRRLRKIESRELSSFYTESDEEEFEEEGKSVGPSKDMDVFNDEALDGDGTSPEPLKRSKLDSVFLNSLKTQKSPSFKPVKQKMGCDKSSRKEVISAICKFFYHAGVPSNAANSPYFHKMLDLVGKYGSGLKPPSSRLITGKFLRDEVTSIREYLEEYRVSWAVSGCSILADSWKDMHGKISINFLVSCPRGIHYLSSADVTDTIDDHGTLFLLLDRVVDEIGEEYIVQVVTEDTSSFRAAGKMLEEKRKNLFWTPCAVRCFDQILEDFPKIKPIGDCLAKAKRITTFIYTSTWLLDYMKKEFTAGKELLTPSVTKFGTTFFTVQNLLDHRIGLKRLFLSSKWRSFRFSGSEESKEMEKTVLGNNFWKKLQYLKKCLDPLMEVLQKINGDQSQSIPFVYNDLTAARFAIEDIHGNDVQKYGSLWNVIDNCWSSLFNHPVHVAAYFLNPSYRYRHDFIAHQEIIRGLNDCIMRLEPDSAKRMAASMQIPDFVSAKGDFGTDLAITTRTELNPAAWWQRHGISCPELQQIAVRVLSQTCSSIGCQQRWSIYDQFHSEGQNSLSKRNWTDLTYVHYNLRLRDRRLDTNHDEFGSMDSTMFDDWITETEPVLDDEDCLYDEPGHDDCENEEEDEDEGQFVMDYALADEHFEVNNPVSGDEELDFLDDDFTD